MQKSDNKQYKSSSNCTMLNVKSAKYVKPAIEVEVYDLVALCKDNLKKIGLYWE